ncbi:MAG: LLM class F420-dependent oxidoreductase [Anaerolineales bacterium]|nr:LLM class F420-dependent oxidoreductase [Anaerolineales bacterium]
MKLGAVFPQTEIGNDPIAIRDYAQAVEGMGYDHLLVYDHVLGADTRTRPDWRGPYTSDTPFHEVFVLYAYLAALTTQIELVTGVLVLPQRQTALVAKQAAQIDLFSGGRLRLGVGVGWNTVEYDALNEDFGTRGARLDEQIQVLRALWTEPVVTFNGRWHHIDAAGINPLPVQRPIPIWFGGHADAALRRAAQVGDGWIPLGKPGAQAQSLVDQLHKYLREAGRTPAQYGMEGHLAIADESPATWTQTADGWRNLGATHLCVNTMRAGFRSPQEHIDALQRVINVLRP